MNYWTGVSYGKVITIYKIHLFKPVRRNRQYKFKETLKNKNKILQRPNLRELN